MRGLVLSRLKNSFFSDMKEVLGIVDIGHPDYNWLISDYVCNHYPSDKIRPNEEYVWIDGHTLCQIVKKNEIQFIWAVFSAFSKNISLGEVLKYKLPVSDGNQEIWSPNFRIQNPLAELEFISWDSSLLVIIARSEELIGQYAKEYPDAIDLRVYNS